MEATPAKWKVFSVICVPGSPTDWAVMAPTASPEIYPQSVYKKIQVLRKVFLIS